MIWKIIADALRDDGQPATGTYPDGFHHLLAKRDVDLERDRNFRDSYGRDLSLCRKLDTAPAAFA